MQEQVSDAANEGFINVVVRCRGRNEAEIRENSNPVVTTEGTIGKAVQLSMGAQSNKTYKFDQVFSPTANQHTIFDHVVKPLLDEMLAGYNCTIFAYGQTGTGKTYTMTGDVAQCMGVLSDEAGIIPRVLVNLFNKLGSTESCVKVSFIELYNEELRDLVSADETAKLKIYDNKSKKGQTSAIVHGMEERHISSAEEGINILRGGTLKRQVAATKYNNLSSRSHTVFTITTYAHCTVQHGEKVFLQAGKLNLVDLAGSENIQRSGAENKHAVEAGLINKSLLTLGRVINALVDRKPQSHIPYRESKLTRLLQDSLGGNTRTSIIATISPTKSSIEETLSTLNYAFRAKNIRNQPELNRPMMKDMFLKELVIELERVKSELACHRQRNGVYLSNEVYEEMSSTTQSQKLIIDEQAAQITTLESNVYHKTQNLKVCTASLLESRRELDDMKVRLEEFSRSLAKSRQSLEEERTAHLRSEEKWTEASKEMMSAVHATQSHIEGLHEKEQRMLDLEDSNHLKWELIEKGIPNASLLIEQVTFGLCREQIQRILSMSKSVTSFLDHASDETAVMQDTIKKQMLTLHSIRDYLMAQNSSGNFEHLIEEITTLCNAALQPLELLLHSTSDETRVFAAGITTDLDHLHHETHTFQRTFGTQVTSAFEAMNQHITAQRIELSTLQEQLDCNARTIADQMYDASLRMRERLDLEKQLVADDNLKLKAEIASLIDARAEAQQSRLISTILDVQDVIGTSRTALHDKLDQYQDAVGLWNNKEDKLMLCNQDLSDTLNANLQDYFKSSSDNITSVRDHAARFCADMACTAEKGSSDLSAHIQSLHGFIAQAKKQNFECRDVEQANLGHLNISIEKILSQTMEFRETTHSMGAILREQTMADSDEAQTANGDAKDSLHAALSKLQEVTDMAAPQRYRISGNTPKRKHYQLRTELPRTESPSPPLLASQLGSPIVARNSFSTENTCSTTIAHQIPETPQEVCLQEVNPNITSRSTLSPKGGSKSRLKSKRLRPGGVENENAGMRSSKRLRRGVER